MRIKETTIPALLVSTTEAADYLNLDDSYPELDNLLRSVQELAEAYTARAFTSRTVQLTLDYAPELVFELPREPVASITGIKTLSATETDADAGTVIASSTYYLADDHRLVFTTTPDIQRDYGGLIITYVAGDKDRTPTAMKTGILKALSTAFENREDYVIGAGVSRLPDNSLQFFNTWKKLC